MLVSILKRWDSATEVMHFPLASTLIISSISSGLLRIIMMFFAKKKKKENSFLGHSFYRTEGVH